MHKLLFFIFLITLLLIYLFKVDKLAVDNISFTNTLKQFYIEKTTAISSNISKYFDGITTIEELSKENQELKQYKILYQTTEKRLKALSSFISQIDLDIVNTKTVTLTRVLSYTSFNDFTKVALDLDKKDESILGLITKDYAAGIVVNDNGKATALLNGNEKCSYAVFIGENKIPGIITASKNKKYLNAKFIPNWVEVKLGDEVITSGMDNIFFEGLKVGKIIDIEKTPQMQIATIKPYANVLEKKYFYAYKHTNKKEIQATFNKQP